MPSRKCEKDRIGSPSLASYPRGSYVPYSTDFRIRLFLENVLLLASPGADVSSEMTQTAFESRENRQKQK